jgi:serine/threonine protein kinase
MELGSGTQIKHYTLVQLLGKGASGEVWKATDGTQEVAIKFMNEALMKSAAAAKHRQRLEREVKALTTLNHPNIPALYDYDLNFSRPYLVMQYIDSPPYERLIATGEMLHVPIRKRLELLTTVAGALSAAHDAGIIHRDIKPGNINGTEKPYLLDFSIALEEEQVEHTNFNIGTTIYMTPDEEPPDRLSDNFSFALVAYEVIFGQHPIFPPKDKTRNMGAYARLQMLQRLKSRDWSLPSRVAKEQLPSDLMGADLLKLDMIFSKALSARTTRYTNLLDFLADLKNAILIPQNEKFMEQTARGIPIIRPETLVENFTELETKNEPAPLTPTEVVLPENYKTGEFAVIPRVTQTSFESVPPSHTDLPPQEKSQNMRQIWLGIAAIAAVLVVAVILAVLVLNR